MLAPSDAAATSAKRRLKVQPFWVVATDFTRRRIALKAQLLAACCRTLFDASSWSSGATGSAQSRRAESNSTSGRSCNSAVSIRMSSATESFGARRRRRSAASAAAETLKSEKLFSRESTALSECEAWLFWVNPALAHKQNSRIDSARGVNLIVAD